MSDDEDFATAVDEELHYIKKRLKLACEVIDVLMASPIWVVVDRLWLYEDGALFDESRPCVSCGLPALPGGEDPCLGVLEGVVAACCGHGVDDGYVMGMEITPDVAAIVAYASHLKERGI